MEVLKNKAYREYSKLSRYSEFPYYYHTLDNKYIYGRTAYLDDSTIFTTHVVKEGESFDTLALHYYNNPTYYWIICSFNHIQDPYMELKPGMLIKIPSISNIKFATVKK